MRKSGNEILRDYEDRLLQERLEQTLTVACAHCAWTVTGLLRDVRGQHTAHRQEHHPEIRPRKIKRLERTFGMVITQKPLDENIAAVRGQGGHRFEDQA